jgi:glycosidase
MGADGFRLDAVPYLVEQGDQLRDTPGTHVFLRDYAGWVRQAKSDAFTVGEVWDSIELMLTYYPEQLDSYFSFALASDLLGAVRTGSGRGLLADYLRIQATLPDGNHSPFLSNHDQTRVATALSGDIAREKLAATLLLTLPGIPFVYYGEEIGMTGDKPDERIRTPMQWSAGPGAGFTAGTPWEPPQPDAAQHTVAGQDADSASLLNLYRRLIHLRSASPALAGGALVPLTAPNDAVVAYLRPAPASAGGGGAAVLVVVNLGAIPLDQISLGAAAAALPAGDYTPASLLGGPAGTLHVDAAGRIQGYVPFLTLGPLEAHVLELRPAAR